RHSRILERKTSRLAPVRPCIPPLVTKSPRDGTSATHAGAGGRDLGHPPFTDPQPMNRRHDLDALRAIAFSLLIVFHVGMLYVDGWDWHLKSSYTTKALDLPMIFLNRWRMDLIFLISGAASFFMMRKSSLAAFVRQRTWRLFLPFAFAMLVVIPVQPYCQGVANGLVEPGFGRFLVHYLT